MIDSPDSVSASRPSQFLDEAIRPISDEQPVGEDITYDESFQEIKREIGKLETLSVEDREGADMSFVVAKCRRVLAKTSKDLRVACYLALGCAKQSVGGDLKRVDTQLLADGLDAVRALCDTYWETMYPPIKRMKIRTNALDYMLDEVRSVFGMIKVSETDRAGLQGCIASLSLLNDACKGEVDAGEVRETIAEAERALNRISRPVALPEKPAPPPVALPDDHALPSAIPAPTTQPQAVAATARAPSDDKISSAGNARRALSKVCAFLLAQELSNPAAYTIARAARWDGLISAPPETDGRTRIPEPRKQAVDAVAALIEKGDYEQALKNAESAFGEAPLHFYFELQRHVVSAAESLGGKFDNVANAVRTALRQLLVRLPEVKSLEFSDGTPFADSSTLAWIENEVLGQAESDGVVAAVPYRTDSVGDAEVFEQAHELVRKKKLAEALGILQQHVRGVRSERDRFAAEHKMASLCLMAKRPDVARPILEGLTETADSFNLDQWNPDQTLLVLKDMLNCYQQLSKKDKSLAGRVEEVFGRICRIDPTFALLNRR